MAPKGKINEDDGISLGKPLFDIFPTPPSVNDPGRVREPLLVQGGEFRRGGVLPIRTPLVKIDFKEGKVELLAEVPREGGFSPASVADDGDFFHGA